MSFMRTILAETYICCWLYMFVRVPSKLLWSSREGYHPRVCDGTAMSETSSLISLWSFFGDGEVNILKIFNLKWIFKDRESEGCLNHLVYRILCLLVCLSKMTFLLEQASPAISPSMLVLDFSFSMLLCARFCLASTRRRNKTMLLSRQPGRDGTSGGSDLLFVGRNTRNTR